jgi:hypothetical protein
MIATGRAGELVESGHPHRWEIVPWLACDCGALCAAPRSESGHLAAWAVCTGPDCRLFWALSVSGADIVGTYAGACVSAFHTHLCG